MSEESIDPLNLGSYLSERSPLPIVAVEGLMHRVLYVNPAFCRLAGKAKEELIGRPFAEAVPEGEANGCLALLNEVYHTGEAANLVEQEHSQNFSPPAYWSYAVWAVLDEEARPTGVMIHVTDATETALFRRQVIAMNAELLLSGIRQQDLTETAQRLNVQLQRAVLETHHRVKNNLQIVSALAEMQMDDQSPTVPTSAMQRIATHVSTLATLHDLLTQQVKANAEDQTLDAQVALAQLLPLLQASVGTRRLHSTIAPMPLTLPQSAALALLVSELVSNALKHGAGEISVTLQRDGEEAHLTIGDEGQGFPPDFDPRAAAHTGLDLIISMAVHDLRGIVQFTNSPEGGASVQITFPLPQ